MRWQDVIGWSEETPSPVVDDDDDDKKSEMLKPARVWFLVW